jgi:hypothetical protein
MPYRDVFCPTDDTYKLLLLEVLSSLVVCMYIEDRRSIISMFIIYKIYFYVFTSHHNTVSAN